MLQWQSLSNGVNGVYADFNNEKGYGRMVVRTVPRRRKNKWCAIFNGRIKSSPKSYSTERRQNFIATQQDAMVICEVWATGVSPAEILTKINEDRMRR